MAVLSMGFAHQVMPSSFCSKAYEELPSPLKVEGLSSMMLHPALERRPFSRLPRLLSPQAWSSVRQVPSRFIESSLPGYQVQVRPFIWNVTIRLSGFLSVALKTLPTL